MRGEDDRGPRGNLVQLLDEDRTLGTQVVDDIAVVHDLVAHVDRGAVLRERLLDDGDRAIDAGAEAAGTGEHDVHQPSRDPVRRMRKLSTISSAAPTVIALSATLNAG